MAKDKAHNPTAVEEIPEVAAFEEVKQRMQQVRDTNAEFFAGFEALAEEYNEKLNAAVRATKSREVSCGDFILYQFGTGYDWEVLYQSLGHQGFLDVGGKVSQIASYDGNKQRFEAAHKSGQVSDEVYNRVVKKTPRFRKPDKVQVA
jgi:hypothetical protein